jgi:thioredoxin-related protein
VDGIEKEFAWKLIVIRVNIQSKVGRSLANEYEFQFTPTFIFFNEQGEEVWRSVGSLDPQQVKDSIP